MDPDPLTKSNPDPDAQHGINLGEASGRGVLSYLICGEGPPGDLPEDESEGVHVRRLEALEGGGDERLVQHLGGHVAPRTHSAHLPQVKGRVSDLYSFDTDTDPAFTAEYRSGSFPDHGSDQELEQIYS